MQMDMDQGGLLAEVKAVMGPGDSTQTCFRREKRGPRWLAGGWRPPREKCVVPIPDHAVLAPLRRNAGLTSP